MRLNVYSDPKHGLFISPGNLEKCLKEGEADLFIYGDDTTEHAWWDAERKNNPHGALHSPFQQLLRGHRLSIREAIAREMKWLGILLLYVWIPLRHILEPSLEWLYGGVIFLSLYMMTGALAQIFLNFNKLRESPILLKNFKISSIKLFPSRPRHPCSLVHRTVKEPVSLKLWAIFLGFCLTVSCIMPIPSTWAIVHPLGGQDYVVTGPTLIRPLSNWHIVPKTHSTFTWTLLRISEDETKIWVYEYQVEWKVTNPKDYRPNEWRLTLDRALSMYFGNMMERMMVGATLDYPHLKQSEQEKLVVEFIAFLASEINRIIDTQLGSPLPILKSSGKVREVSMSEFGNYYRQTRQR